MRRFLLPLIVFVVLLGFLGAGLRLNPREVPSPFIGKPAPAFRLPQLHAQDKTLAPEDLKGKVWLLNVWASWCVSCRQEHPVLLDIEKGGLVPVYGLDYKDDPVAGQQWLQQHGDPYALSVIDRDGKIGIEYGVYGVPETFLIDKAGVIRYKHIGPMTHEAFKGVILPKVKELNGA
ncbi:MAG TPA: DsbE family thiol:disulfide interchange protein [Rhodocyclaceae bacterium]|nr:DsbE family thiol:disulfide interchange protein [Rhodocyclaceae bacterium]